MIAARYFVYLTAITGSAIFAQSTTGAATLNPNTGQQFPAKNVALKCIAFTTKFESKIRECAISKAADLGIFGGKRYRYVLYCMLANYVPADVHCSDGSYEATNYAYRGLVLFAETPGSAVARVVWQRAGENIGDLRFEPPELVKTKAGSLLYLPIRVDGSGAFNESEYYLWGPSGWRQIDGEAWLSDPKFAIPPAFEMTKDIWPDLRTMKAEFRMYRRDGSTCCPFGLIAKITLVVKANELALESFELEEIKPEQ